MSAPPSPAVHPPRPGNQPNHLRRAGSLGLLAPFYFMFLVFWMVPLAGGVQLSLFSDELYGATQFVGLAHYRTLLHDGRFARALGNTALYTVACIGLVVPIALFLAQALQQTYRRWRPFLTFSLLLPGLTPPAVLALLFLLVFHGEQGLLNHWLVRPLGGSTIQWLQDPTYILPALVLQAIWRWTGLITFFFLAGMEGIPRSYYEAASLETSHPWRIWRRLTLPLLRPVIIFAVIYLVVDAFSMFSGAYVLLGGSGGTADAGLLLISYNYQTAFTFGRFGSAAAMSLTTAPLLLGILWLGLRVRRHIIS